MQRNKVNKRLSIFNLQAESGFTLIEMLISLSMILVILAITPSLWNYLQLEPQTEQFSVYQFFHVVTDEIQLNQLLRQSEDSLLLENSDNDQILISKYNNTIRRQVNRTGHEILLRDIEKFELKYNDHYLLIQLQMESGNTYEKVITIFKK